MTDLERKAIAALYWPGWLEIGTPDVSARIAERGAGWNEASGHEVDEWDWQRRITIPLVGGGTQTIEFPPSGYIRAGRSRPSY